MARYGVSSGADDQQRRSIIAASRLASGSSADRRRVDDHPVELRRGLIRGVVASGPSQTRSSDRGFGRPPAAPTDVGDTS